MTDTYTQLVNSGPGRNLAKKLGLPQPAVLRRYKPGQPLATGPVVVLGDTAGADKLAAELLSWDLDVRRHAVPAEKLGAIIMVLDELQHPADLEKPVLAAAGSLRDLRGGGRVITVSRPAAQASSPDVAAARQGVDGFLRSLAKELRAGATGNGVVLAEGTSTTSPSALGAVRFFLSGRSAFVDGQFLAVSSEDGSLAADPDKPLAGKVAVVTGAARGIGAQIARTMHRDGAMLILVDIPAAGDQLATVANEVRATALQLDISRSDAGQRIIDHAVQRHGRLDIVVHNAGVTRDKLLANMDQARWNSVININIAAQAPHQRGTAGIRTLPVVPAYRFSCFDQRHRREQGANQLRRIQGGVIGMVRATAPLLASRGGTINAVAPGFIETEMTARIPFAVREVARRLNSLQQGGLPSDVAETIAFLASDAAGGINGEVLRVCGQNLVGA
ncbi:3-oxoacyl-ACP reductase [Pseudarthrobacter sp. Fe7]|nr:3-oxoacyl-ACP reductase [Pseudarthrobacter sp. Fe7]